MTPGQPLAIRGVLLCQEQHLFERATDAISTRVRPSVSRQARGRPFEPTCSCEGVRPETPAGGSECRPDWPRLRLSSPLPARIGSRAPMATPLGDVTTGRDQRGAPVGEPFGIRAPQRSPGLYLAHRSVVHVVDKSAHAGLDGDERAGVDTERQHSRSRCDG
jgi:hypothetical protein